MDVAEVNRLAREDLEALRELPDGPHAAGEASGATAGAALTACAWRGASRRAALRPGEQSGYVAECLEIPVVTQGRTLDEVTRNLQEAAVALHLDGEELAALGLAASPTVVVTMELQPTHA